MVWNNNLHRDVEQVMFLVCNGSSKEDIINGTGISEQIVDEVIKQIKGDEKK